MSDSNTKNFFDQNSNEFMKTQIVSAYAGRSDVSVDDIMNLLARLTEFVNGASPSFATAAPTAPSQVEPAVPLDKAITKDKVFCLCCGKGFKMLKRHLGAEHGLTEAEYRTMFSLPDDLPLVAPSYSKKKAAYAKEAGFGKYSREGRAGAGKSETIT